MLIGFPDRGYIDPSPSDTGNIMDYGAIVNNAFKVAWRYKTLWIFGLFAGVAPQFNYEFGADDLSAWNTDPNLGLDALGGIAPWTVIGPTVGAAIMLLITISFLASCIAEPALIDAVNRIARGGRYRFGESFSTGVDFFWRFLGFSLLLFFIGIAALFVLVIAGIFTFTAGTGVGILSLLVLIPLAIVSGFIIINIFMLGKRAIVVRNIPISDALEEGWLLLKQNPGPVIVVTLIAFAIGLSIVMAIGFGVISLPFLVMIGSMQPSLELLFLGILIGLPVTLIVGGFSGTLFSSLYTLFYFQLVEPGTRHYIPSETDPISPEPSA